VPRCAARSVRLRVEFIGRERSCASVFDPPVSAFACRCNASSDVEHDVARVHAQSFCVCACVYHDKIYPASAASCHAASERRPRREPRAARDAFVRAIARGHSNKRKEVRVRDSCYAKMRYVCPPRVDVRGTHMVVAQRCAARCDVLRSTRGSSGAKC